VSARRNTAVVVAAFVAAWPVTVPMTVASFTLFRALFGWWPWQVPWTGPRYR
jgi:hypothetical protein